MKIIKVRIADAAFTWQDKSSGPSGVGGGISYIAKSKIFPKAEYHAGTFDNRTATIDLWISGSLLSFDISQLKMLGAGKDYWDKDLLKSLKSQEQVDKFKQSVPKLLAEMKKARMDIRSVMKERGDIY